jgi:putative ABC transport system permease protein
MLRRQIRYWLDRNGREAALRAEMEAHIEECAATLEEQGQNRTDALAQARRRFGNLLLKQEESREVWIARWWADFVQDLRHGVRMLAADPGFAAAAILTLALGIGANTAIFSVVKAVLLEPLPYYRSDRVVQLIQNVPAALSITGKPSQFNGMSFVEMFELQKRSETLAQIAAYETRQEVTLGEEDPVRIVGTKVSASLFPMLGTQPVLGRAFSTAEEKPNAEQPVILSYAAWQKYFAGDTTVLNRKIRLDGRGAVVGGVMPAGFEFPDSASEFWMPLDLTPPVKGEIKFATPLARLKDDVPMETAAAEITTIVGQVRQTYPPDRADPPASFEVRSIKDEMVRPVRSALLILMVAVAFVLLIGCGNVANLLLVRGAARQGELAIRAALGAGHGRLIRQTITESMVLGLTGGGTGLAVATAGIGFLRSFRSENVPRIDTAALDPGVLAFTLALGVLTSLLFGFIPAIQLSRDSHTDVIKKNSVRHSTGHQRMRNFVVIGETAMAIMLLIGGALLVRSFLNLVNVNPGFDPEHVLGFQVALPDPRNANTLNEGVTADFEGRLRSLPGVKSVAFANALPLVARDGYTQPRIQGTPLPMPGQPDYREVSPNYFGTMGLHILSGRGFLEADRPGEPKVVIINQAMAKYFGGENPIGKQITLGRDPAEIVGIVNDVHKQGLGAESRPEVFADFRQSSLRRFNNQPVRWAYFVIRSDREPKSMLPDIRSILAQILPGATLKLNATDMAEALSNSIARPRLYAELVGIFGAVAVALGVIGIYGVTRYSVTRRTREIGIRIALGARPSEVLGLAMRQSLATAAIGIVIGLAGAAWITRYLQGMLFGLAPLDPATFAVVAVAFAATALVSAWLPARRATRINPLSALRYE